MNTPLAVSPVSIAIKHSRDFIFDHIEGRNLRLLEVGCGSGLLAQSLIRSGLKVTAIDLSAEAVEKAKANSVDASQANILDYTDDPFDVILFARSLHHMTPLEEVLSKTKSLLKTGGVLLIEDFAAEEVNYETVQWRYQLEDIIEVLGIASQSFDAADSVEDPLERWHHHYFVEHSVATSREMITALSAAFGSLEVGRVPYLYRYVVEKLTDTPQNTRLSNYLIEEEQRLISRGRILPVGLRIKTVKR